MKVKSESEVAQSCPTLRDPMDCSLPGSSVHGIFQASRQVKNREKVYAGAGVGRDVAKNSDGALSSILRIWVTLASSKILTPTPHPGSSVLKFLPFGQ